MNLRGKTIAGAAIALIAIAATGCGSHLANNTHGLGRAHDGTARHGVVEQRAERTTRHNNHRRGLNRMARRTNSHLTSPNAHSRRGIDRTATENRYLHQNNSVIRDGNAYRLGNEAVVDGTINNRAISNNAVVRHDERINDGATVRHDARNMYDGNAYRVGNEAVGMHERTVVDGTINNNTTVRHGERITAVPYSNTQAPRAYAR